jgi:hypothetical protein
MKRCARCKIWKDEEDFNWRYVGIMRQSICRECQRLQRREHYERHTETGKEKDLSSNQAPREDAQRFIYEYLSYQKCADCGEYDFSLLTFDHVEGKKMDISRMVAKATPLRLLWRR